MRPCRARIEAGESEGHKYPVIHLVLSSLFWYGTQPGYHIVSQVPATQSTISIVGGDHISDGRKFEEY